MLIRHQRTNAVRFHLLEVASAAPVGNRRPATMGWGTHGRTETYCLRGTELKFAKMTRILEMDGGGMHNDMSVLNATELWLN